MDNNIITWLNSLPLSEQLEIWKELKKWGNALEIQGKMDILQIKKHFELCKLNGKVTPAKLATSMGLRKQEQKNELYQYIKDNPYLVVVNSVGHVLEVYEKAELNHRSKEFRVMMYEKARNTLLLYDDDGKGKNLYLTVFGRYLSLINHPNKINAIVMELENSGMDWCREARIWNGLAVYDFHQNKFSELNSTNVYLLTNAGIDYLSSQFNIVISGNREYSRRSIINEIGKLREILQYNND